jgi:hypothetical protein
MSRTILTLFALLAALLPAAAQTRVDPAQIRADHSQTAVDASQTQGAGGTRIAAGQVGVAVSGAVSWWAFDLPTQAYQYTGPTCWLDVVVAAPPTNCRVIAWRGCDLATDTVRQNGYLSCDLTIWHGLDPNGDGCDRGTPASDSGCTLDGTSTVMPAFREDLELPCGASLTAPVRCPAP